MRNVAIGPILLLAAAILLATPPVAVPILSQALAASPQHGPARSSCMPHDIACRLGEFTRFTGISPELLDRLARLGVAQLSTKRGLT